MRKTNGGAIGIRGVISDRNTKILLLVNGRVMNHRGVFGVLSERMISVLGDIEYIDVVRGPGSAIYGPGAIAGVINIVTYDGLSFEGGDVQIRQGFVEEFTSLELRYGKKLAEDHGFFIYYGVDLYGGADQSDAPFFFSNDFLADGGQQVTALDAVPFTISDDRQAYQGDPRHKVHIAYEHGGFDAWVRYTRGGLDALELTIGAYMNAAPSVIKDSGTGYEQLTLMMNYEHRVSEHLRINFRLSHDRNESEQERPGLDRFFEAREDEYHARVLANWEPFEQHRVASAVEYSHETFEKSHEPPFSGASLKEWSTQTVSLLGEYQWLITPQWRLFLGGRADKHTYTDWLYSPRAALIFAPSEKDTLKALYNRSVRRADDSDIRALRLATGSVGEAEKIDSFELRYERQHTGLLHFSLAAYYSDYSVLAWTFNLDRSTLLGDLRFYGVEGELTYEGDRLRAILSHNYTKHLDFDLKTPTITRQNISASAYGYGDDLASWSNHNTKLAIEYDLTSKWMASASLRVLWGFPGGKDLANYNRNELGNDVRLPVTDGSDRAWKESVFLNLGLQYEIDAKTLVRCDGHSLLGLFHGDLNKRNAYQRTTAWRNEAPSVSIIVKRKF
jgi:outer membrane receptor protein involved in Fe transport